MGEKLSLSAVVITMHTHMQRRSVQTHVTYYVKTKSMIQKQLCTFKPQNPLP